MKTPLMELIAYIDEIHKDSVFAAPSFFRAKCVELLEQEKNIIDGAYISGRIDGIFIAIGKKYDAIFTDASDYYTKTFTNESK